MQKVWIIRGERRAVIVPQFLQMGIAAISFGKAREFARPVDIDELVRHAQKYYPEQTKRGWTNGARQMRCVLDEIQDRSWVATYDANHRKYILGRVLGDYRYRPDLHLPECNPRNYPYAYTRDVKWSVRIPRDELSNEAKSRLWRRVAVFDVDGPVAAELVARAAPAGRSVHSEVRIRDDMFQP